MASPAPPRRWPARPRVVGHAVGGRLADSGGVVESVSLDPARGVLAAAGASPRISLWDIADPSRPRLAGPPLTGPACTVYSVGFSPDGHLLAAGSADDAVRLVRGCPGFGRITPLGRAGR